MSLTKNNAANVLGYVLRSWISGYSLWKMVIYA